MRLLILSSSSSGGHGCLIRSTQLLRQLPINITVYHPVIKSGLNCDSIDIQIRKLILSRASMTMVSFQNDEDGISRKGKSMTKDPSRMNDHIRIRDQGIKLPVNYNAKGQPIGDTSKTLASWIGVVVRQRVPIHIKDWRLVPQEVKEVVWKEITSIYIIPEYKKDFTLTRVDKIWKQFKNYMTSRYIRKGFIDAPPCGYSWIKQDNWNKFVQQRITEEFQEISAKHREIHSSVNKYPHTMSRHGYARMEEDLIKQRSSESGEQVSTIDRSELWRIVRRKSDGSYVSKDAGYIAERIDSFSQSASQGDIHPSGRDDILEIGANTISVWMRYLFYKYADVRFGFLDPVQIAYGRNVGIEGRAKYISDTMLRTQDHRLYFAQYNVGEHWVLCIIDDQNGKGYYLDPLRADVREDIAKVVDVAPDNPTASYVDTM